MTDTEIRLRLWRGDQIGAERLAAAILHVEGFASVDPQCPLGGPDGLKDVLCEKNAWKYVAAVYFPNAQQTAATITRKYNADLLGVGKNGADGFIFITNQSISPSQRTALIAGATKAGHKAIIYHVERINAILDSPAGYGARLQYLGIGLSPEDQLSFLIQWEKSLDDKLHASVKQIVREVSELLNRAEHGSDVLPQFWMIANPGMRTIASPGSPPPTSDKSAAVADAKTDRALDELSVRQLCLLHSALMSQENHRHVGSLRSVQNWIGGSKGIEEAAYIPPPPAEVPPLVEALLSEWNRGVKSLKGAPVHARLSALTRFHHGFLSIHPFLDGNGRVARFLLAQQARELLGTDRPLTLEDRQPYFEALTRAHDGDLAPLEAVLTQAIFGTDTLPTDG